MELKPWDMGNLPWTLFNLEIQETEIMSSIVGKTMP
jgi:hypothetical protein